MSSKARSVNYRNPVYVVYIVIGLILLLLSAQMVTGRPSLLGSAILDVIKVLPSWFTGLFAAISVLGSLGFVYIMALLALALLRFKASLKIIISGSAAYLIAGLFHSASWLPSDSFPDSHMAVATAIALVGYQYTPKARHRFITAAVVLIAIAQMYLGQNEPMDIVGGYAVGLIVGAAVCMAFGRRIFAVVSPKEVRKALIRNGYTAKSVKVLGVDARGSSPFIATFESGQRYFIKVVNRDNFVADWLFKAYRRLVYRRLEDEVPFFSPKSQIEHETYVANLAYANGIHTPRIVGVLEVKPNTWAQIQEAIDGKSLDGFEAAEISDKLLNKIFKLVNQLHNFHIVHRDLRAANIFIDKKHEPWLIDFGFAEASAKPKQYYRDLVELICSIGVIVGADRIIKATLGNVSRNQIVASLPYMQYACLSGETTRLMKQKKELLPQIMDGLKRGTSQQTVKTAKVARFKPGSRKR